MKISLRNLLPKSILLSVFVVGIIILAGFLRLYRIADYMTFLGDEGRDALIVYNILHGKLTLLGPTASVGGFFLGPIYYYFMAPFLWLFRYDPVGPAIMVALIGIITVFLVYKVGASVFGEKAGIIASFLYALSPVVIAYSRSSWNPNLMPFFSLITLYLLYKSIEKKKYVLFFIVGVLLGISLQLHYIIVFLGATVFFYTFCMDYMQNQKDFFQLLFQFIKQMIVIFCGFLLGWSPFLLFEIRHGFQNITSIYNFIFHSGDTGGNSNLILTSWNVLYRLFGRLVTAYPPPEQVSIQAHTHMAVWYYATVGLLLASIAIFLYQYIVVKKDMGKSLQYNLLLFWGVIGIFLFGFYKKPIYDYYFEFMFPLPFLLVGNLLGLLFEKKGKLFEVRVIAAVIIVSALSYINIQGMPFRSTPNRQKEQVKQIAEFVLSKTSNRPFNFALLTLGNSDHGYRYFFRIHGKEPTVIENTVLDPSRKTVTDQLLVICEDPNCQPLGASLWEVAGFGRAEIVEKWNVSVVQVYKLKHYTEPHN